MSEFGYFDGLLQGVVVGMLVSMLIWKRFCDTWKRLAETSLRDYSKATRQRLKDAARAAHLLQRAVELIPEYRRDEFNRDMQEAQAEFDDAWPQSKFGRINNRIQRLLDDIDEGDA